MQLAVNAVTFFICFVDWVAAFYLLNNEYTFVRLTHWKDVGSFNASSS
jgi:hypothetical protein